MDMSNPANQDAFKRELSIGVNCLLAVRKLMTRLGIATNESIEGFGAEIEHNLFSLARVANAFMDSVQRHSLTAPQPSQPAASEAARDVPARRFRHVKTGGIYTLLSGALNEATKEPLIVYRSEETGVIWVRPAKEFDDGRFAEIERLDRAEEKA